jgi:hypothetical protein
MDPEVRQHCLHCIPDESFSFPRVCFAPRPVRPLLAGGPRFSFSFLVTRAASGPIAQERHGAPWKWAQWRSPGARMLRQSFWALDPVRRHHCCVVHLGTWAAGFYRGSPRPCRCRHTLHLQPLAAPSDPLPITEVSRPLPRKNPAPLQITCTPELDHPSPANLRR